MCALFTKEKKLKIVPRTEESKVGGQYLTGLVKGTPPTIPTREVAGLTPTQLIISRGLEDLMVKTGMDAEAARTEIMKTLTDKYDPRTSPYYRGLREETERLKTEGVTDIRQASELGGMFKSTPRLGAEGELINVANSNLLKQLGLLYETERGRKSQAARDIQDVGTKEIGKYAAIGAMSDIERQLEQEVMNAKYTQAIEQMLFPYREQVGIATALLGVKEDFYMTGGGLTDLGFGVAAGANALASFAGAGGFSSGGGGGTTAGGTPGQGTMAWSGYK